MPAAIDLEFCRLLSDNHARIAGGRLIPEEIGDAAARAQWLYGEAPFCVLAHNTQADPVFIYANRAAQRCFEYEWEEITRLPSRLSAQAPDRAGRQLLLDAVRRDGFIRNYQGIRIAKSGRRFQIENATVWQLIDAAGTLQGQAAMFRDWRNI